MIEAAIKILLNEIKYEVKFESWRLEKVINDEQRNAARKEYKAVDYAYKDDKAEDWLVRQIQDAVDNVTGELRWCVVDNSRMQSDEIAENPTEWLIVFRFDDSWKGSVRRLKSCIHRYVNDYTIAKWYRASGKVKEEQDYEMTASENLLNAYEEARSGAVSLEPWRL